MLFAFPSLLLVLLYICASINIFQSHFNFVSRFRIDGGFCHILQFFSYISPLFFAFPLMIWFFFIIITLSPSVFCSIQSFDIFFVVFICCKHQIGAAITSISFVSICCEVEVNGNISTKTESTSTVASFVVVYGSQLMSKTACKQIFIGQFSFYISQFVLRCHCAIRLCHLF